MSGRAGGFPEDWPNIRARYEAWWEGELAGAPLLQVTAPAGAGPAAAQNAPTDGEALRRWLTDPALVIPRLEGRVAGTYYAGDAFPVVDPVSLGLVAIEAAYLGCRYTVAPDSLTGWAEPLIEDWATRPPLAVDAGNPWWQATQRLLDAGARAGAGRFSVALPDLQGGGEILALLRGSERLALDLYDYPEAVGPALAEINAAWLHYYQTCTAIVGRWQPGYVDWLGIWSESPAVTVECDFAAMISPRMFERHFLPAVAQQTRWVERTIFHLDGPQCLPHLDALLALPRLRGIQWVPTPARPDLCEWVPLLRRIQAAGKRVVVACGPAEVLPLLDALDPARLLLSTICATPAAADALVGEVARRCAK